MKSRSNLLFTEIITSNKMNPVFTADWKALHDFLSTRALVEPYLAELETALQQYAATHEFSAALVKSSDNKLKLPEDPNYPLKCYKVFSRYISQWALANGFERKAKLFKALSANQFYSLLASKTIFTDYADDVGPRHGAWSHALQWYCIIEHQKKSHFLEHDPLAVYQGFASPENIAQMPLWEWILDSLSEPDFTSPEFMMNIILHPDKQSQWPLLSGSMDRKERKLFLKHQANEFNINDNHEAIISSDLADNRFVRFT